MSNFKNKITMYILKSDNLYWTGFDRDWPTWSSGSSTEAKRYRSKRDAKKEIKRITYEFKYEIIEVEE